MEKYEELRSINVKLYLNEKGELEKVKALPGENYDILDDGTATDILEICTKKQVVLTDTAFVLITQENPTCLRWKVRVTQNGWDVICVEWRE